MKLIIAIILFAASLSSCSKSKTCYYCTFGVDSNGNVPTPQVYCGEDGPSHIFTDVAGNRLSSQCVPQ